MYAPLYCLVSKFVEVRDVGIKGQKDVSIEKIKLHRPHVAAHLVDFTHQKTETLID